VLQRAEFLFRWVPRRALPRLDQALVVLVPAVTIGLIDALGALSPWSLAALGCCLVLLAVLVWRGERTRTIPFTRTFLWAAVGFACLCAILSPFGNPLVSGASLVALVFLIAAFAARGLAAGVRLPLKRATLPDAPLRRGATPPDPPLGVARERATEAAFGWVYAGIVAAAALVLAVVLGGALRPEAGIFTTASLDLRFGGNVVSLGLGAAKVAILADSLAGGILVAAAAGAFGARRAFAVAAGIAWIAAYARLGPVMWNATPTFIVPLYVFVLSPGWPARRPLYAGLVAALAGLLYWPLLVPLSVLALGWWIWQPLPAERRAVARAFACGALAGAALALLPGSLIRLPATLVAAPLDEPLRLVGADGVWPWLLLVPSLTSGIYSGLGSLLVGASGFAGNALWVTAAPGWALVAALIAAGLTLRRTAPRATRAALAVALAVVYLALPSHIFSVPLPTPAEVTYLAGGSGWLASSAALALVAVAALAGAAALESFAQRRGRRLAAAAGLLLVLLDAYPAGALFPNLPASAATGALRESQADPQHAALLASLYDDDPRARLARAQVEALFGLSPAAARAFVRPLPATDRLEPGDLGFPRLAVAVVDLSAYNLYRDAPFSGFIFVPNDLSGTLTAPEQVANPEIERTLIKSVYGNDYAYSYER
jgi:hypothetical protein